MQVERDKYMLITGSINLYSNEKEITIKSSLVDQNLASFFGRVNYKLMDRYMLTASCVPMVLLFLHQVRNGATFRL